MPRRPRIHLAGIPMHLVQRGINREPCFFAGEDYRWRQKSAADWDCAIHACALMAPVQAKATDGLEEQTVFGCCGK